MLEAISRTELARKTREIVERVRRGQLTVVKSYGEEQIVLLDVLDYRILRALAVCATGGEAESNDDPGLHAVIPVMRAYLDERVNLGKAAEGLGLSRFDLMERFQRLGVPLRIGPASLEEARAEAEGARGIGPPD